MTFFKYIARRFFGRTKIDSLEVNQGAWYIDETAVTATAAQLNAAGTVADTSVTAASLGPDVAGATMTGGNGQPLRINAFKIFALLAPGTGVGVNVPITGMLPGDYVVSVMAIKVNTGMWDRTSEYTAGTGAMVKAAGTNETGNTLIVAWNSTH